MASNPSPQDRTFVDEVENELICPICLHVMTDPVALECGHLLCRGCARDHRQGTSSETRDVCPTCKGAPSAAVTTAWHTRMKIKGQRVKCLGHVNGCEHIASLQHIQEHEHDCPFISQPCPSCRTSVPRGELLAHQTDQCPQRVMPCFLCSFSIRVVDMPTHIALSNRECLNAHLCPNGCNTPVPDHVLREHRAVCTHRPVICPSCQTVEEHRNFQSHLQTNLVDHFFELHAQVQRLQAEKASRDVVDRLGATVRRLEALQGNPDIRVSVHYFDRDGDEKTALDQGVAGEERTFSKAMRLKDLVEACKRPGSRDDTTHCHVWCQNNEYADTWRYDWLWVGSTIHEHEKYWTPLRDCACDVRVLLQYRSSPDAWFAERPRHLLAEGDSVKYRNKNGKWALAVLRWMVPAGQANSQQEDNDDEDGDEDDGAWKNDCKTTSNFVQWLSCSEERVRALKPGKWNCALLPASADSASVVVLPLCSRRIRLLE